MVYDVVIVGCGPVGALAANLLGREGLSVLVLEKELEHYPLPRAVHLDHEMMRLFQGAGVIDRVLPDMIAADGHLHIGADHGVIRYMGTVGKPKPFGWANDWFFYQPELETHLRAGMAGLDTVALELGAEFAALEQDGETVTVHYLVDGAPRTAAGRWLIAADGSRSPVRKALGVALDDLQFEEPWLVVDAEVEGPVSFPPLTGVPAGADLQRLSVMMCDPARPATVVPGRGNHRRWEFMLLPHEDDAEMMQPAKVGELVGAWMKDVPHRIVRAATYRFHGLVAEQWQVGRVFLAGDAAHQTPPFFGQGMCHGFRDAANLAWKLAAVVREGAPASLLETYQPERDPHVRGVIGAAVAAGRYICELDPAKAAARDAEIRARAAERAGETAADLIPAIARGVVLPGGPGAGERFIQPLLADGRRLDDLTGQGWRLFASTLPDGPVAAGVGLFTADDLPDGGAVRTWLAERNVAAVLVRPDHYVFGTGAPGELLAARAAALTQPAEMAA
ncbi:bifunctional 3-(3-hydroxy-phenyl)propionate/3-hydroxycinnamic acid hydroxylase [Novosphingobium piscinae]|uniref:Bifunctional 3-(3-hydroxy-phenyl)propionate/3-hydroxycinnamic acid hydroxylase n=1 Tax=Novosphingobium piscinae TaxID=1507448 RepID=A0A7X1FXH4_9SPHN|nr:bifunctional 3-(3-hydroxy-phenyl)propionate/3-hydroxycinnamic acid hydroxylase [Novosphingobium piscinae]MBC2668828.1 bifunctional 3-(3-hydroxy-phenyl)propionate/3-hydroxycinnamic acid hydroxylase [Novosphingobium piscinae]